MGARAIAPGRCQGSALPQAGPAISLDRADSDRPDCRAAACKSETPANATLVCWRERPLAEDRGDRKRQKLAERGQTTTTAYAISGRTHTSASVAS